jgi:YegS/Rv2252/BmrU family lipid kinase
MKKMEIQHQMIKTHVIINLLSAAGKTGRKWKSYLSAIEYRLGKNYSIHFTRAPLDATYSTQQAIKKGCETVIAIGGDGTFNEVVNGFFENGRIINSECALGIINSGTGHGFAQSLGLHKSFDNQLNAISQKLYNVIDIGDIRYINQAKEPAERFFINECQIGIGGTVVKNLATKYKRFGGAFAFGFIALLTTLSDKTRQYNYKINGILEISAALHGIVVGNGAFMGGGMMLTPMAKSNDGLLDILTIEEQSVFNRIINLSKVHSGRHLKSKKFSYRQCTSLTIASPDNALIAADGEILGTPPATIRIIPHVLRVYSLNGDDRL